MKNKVISDLDNKLVEMLNNRDAFKRHFSKDDLSTYIDYLISNHKSITMIFTMFSQKYRLNMARKMQDKMFVKSLNLGPYIDYRKRLSGKAEKAEFNSFFSTLEHTNREYEDLLVRIQSELDTYFANDKINLFNMRISHVVLIGIMYQSEQLSNYIKYLISCVSLAMNLEDEEIPKYRKVYLEENVSNVAKIVNAIYQDAGAKDYKGMIKNIKINAADFTLLSDENIIQVNKADSLKLSEDSRRVMTMGILGLPSFRSIGESINVYKNWSRKGRLIEQEWLKAHTALLVNKLNDMDESDPEYQKLAKIVKRYESAINKQQRQLDKRK